MKKKKYSKRKIRKRKRTLNFLLFVLIITLLYLFVFKTSFFNIKSIKVSGNNKMSYGKIVKASNCIKNENIFKISKKLGEENLTSLPYIKEAKLKRKLPSTITIEIKEREEIAIIPYIGSFAFIDEEGYILVIKAEKGESILPQISGFEVTELEAGNNLFDYVGREDIQNFIALSRQNNLLSLMKYINLSDNNNTMIELNNGIKVAFGPLDNVKYKLSFLYKILEDIEERDLKVKQILLNKSDDPIIVIDNQ